jgi:hypothetical protein
MQFAHSSPHQKNRLRNSKNKKQIQNNKTIILRANRSRSINNSKIQKLSNGNFVLAGHNNPQRQN